MTFQRTLLIFAKPARMGVSKTRLAADIGPTEAQRINRFCHSRAMRAARSDRSWTSIICVAPDSAVTLPTGGLWPADFQRQPQGLGDLGERLARAFKRAPPGPVAVIGTDIPDLSGKLIRTAFNALRRRDVVFGPADDGGFWLFAVSHAMRRQPIAFAPVRWSTPHAMSDLIASLPASTRITRLRTLADLDDAASLKEWSCRR